MAAIAVPAYATEGSALPMASAACTKATEAIITETLTTGTQGDNGRLNAAYTRACKTWHLPIVRNLGYLDAPELMFTNAQRPLGIKRVTSSNPNVVALGPGTPLTTTSAGSKPIKTTKVTQYMVGTGRSTVCYIPFKGAKDCHVVVVPDELTGVAPTNDEKMWDAFNAGRTVFAFSSADDTSGISATQASSTDQAVVQATNPDPNDEVVKVAQVEAVGVGTARVCATFTTGATACQTWTVQP